MAVILVLDVGTTTMRAALVDDRLQVVAIESRSMPPSTPFPGLVEFDAAAMAAAALDAATTVLGRGAGARRRRDHQPAGEHDRVGPGDGRADRARASAGRTCAPCSTASPPRQNTACRWPRTSRSPSWPGCSPTSPGAGDRDLCFGTVDTLVGVDADRRRRCTSPTTPTPPSPVSAVAQPAGWNERARRRPSASRWRCCRASSTRAVSSARRRRCPGAPPIAALVGDQQASLVGQGCVRPRPGQDHVRIGRDARPVHRDRRRRRRTSGRRTAPTRSSPGRATAR